MFNQRFPLAADRTGWPDNTKVWIGIVTVLNVCKSETAIARHAAARIWIIPPRDGVAEKTPLGTFIHGDPEEGRWGAEVSGNLDKHRHVIVGTDYELSLLSGVRCRVVLERMTIKHPYGTFTASFVGFGLPPAIF